MDTFPVGFYELDATDEISICVGGTYVPKKVGEFKDKRGRSPKVMIELVDADRFFFVSEQPARDFMLLHGMAEATEEELADLRKADETD